MLDRDRLIELFEYNPETGDFVRRFGVGGKAKGSIAGSVNNNGYKVMFIDSVRYSCHRLAWLYFHGEWPNVIDHINGDRADNRICNLRNVTVVENARNRGMDKRNTSGQVGVSWCDRTSQWRADIMFNGRQKFIMRTRDYNLAVMARVLWQRVLGFHPNHGKR